MSWFRRGRSSTPSYSKYGVRTDKRGIAARTIDNIEFHSQKEANRYKELKLIHGKNLKIQHRIPIIVHGQKICDYIADFVYRENGEIIIEDVKGFQTPEFRIKWKLLKALHPEWVFVIT